MRNRYLVAYDVSDDKRLRKMHKTILGFGEPLQYSVFCCDLTPTQHVQLIEKVLDVMNEREDRVMVADLGPARGRASDAIEWMGRRPKIKERRWVIV